ncbi:universal stress protein [Thermomicrobium sp. CFH 73360]|uniref:universal stress protein n=1 Tax=Thermomicrobium sp. CFH 73360 TaxID=2951987 RepID=UPI00207741EE|nr:universal stress protein [Thermomicrobium sp. CFH 73360]MCM8746217.1 universal stress protein [Thermomicrobium sp. CFH 73360]
MYRKILVGFDGSDGAKAALRHAIELARRFGAELWSLSVIETPHWATATVGEVDEQRRLIEEELERLQQAARTQAAEFGLEIHAVTRLGHPAQLLVQEAQRGNFDLLVIGHSGRSGVWGVFLGTTADKVVRHAPCSVLVVRW